MKEVVKDPEKEQSMIEASLKLFGNKGFAATKMEEIALEAGVSKGLLFHYFGNKTNLYLETYEYARQFFYQQINPAVWASSNDFSEMVEQSMRYKLGLQIKYPLEFNFLFYCMGEIQQLPEKIKSQLSEKMQEEYQVTIQLITPVLDRMKIKAPYTRDDVLRVLYFVVQGETEAIQKEMSMHPEWVSLEQLEPMVKRMKTSLTLVQNGFLKE
ncbi:TetR/AcrR family transcriptional regulator [Candidatus Enterococcus ferrettii]|uniref:HTH tetR-type domain-containing protein n=1 Tax=Candidatus Enterococcus ferrettii TaxID=2815324 RepID=A0ABV0ETG1_9ENTE|nr:TetR/AcrR family transcriptional regulator [Enterococcus sp. 665A]MBO1342182.1 TetR/AcrR family transcriptional regulator [Enterococcus sp. 665A]